ncbi:hypothetical protein LSH36_877g01018 [Paralvinella palmiformis]|uniref:CUB domain-containing protein n=1 Tax=Paralvinella palmiformis TaxID=53620 RepID=A0AAD9IYL8_9ANNE|nr:hypothetical protein LSH36_877g01018 [Paralvinella palmiformis]
MMLWRCLVVLLIGLRTSAEPLTSDIIACYDPLSLFCNQNQVVATEVYTVPLSFAVESTSSEHCACTNQTRHSLVRPLTIVADINECRWKTSTCTLHLMPIFTPCLVAKQFHCVNRADIVDICTKSPYTLTNNHQYITSPGYPSVYTGGLQCCLIIRIPSGKSVFVRIISSHLPPNCDKGEDLDYLEISPSGGNTFRFCGDVKFDVNKTWIFYGESIQMKFISRKRAKTYQGFVLYYECLTAQHSLKHLPLAIVIIVQLYLGMPVGYVRKSPISSTWKLSPVSEVARSFAIKDILTPRREPTRPLSARSVVSVEHVYERRCCH